MDLKNPIDQDRIKLFPKPDQKQYAAQAEGGMNDAQLIDEMRQSGTLTKLDPRDYPLPSASAKTQPQEFDEGYGFKRGDKVYAKLFWPWGVEECQYRVLSVLESGVRLSDGCIYPTKHLRHA